jgi:Carboxypeptidase regulatory-like domain
MAGLISGKVSNSTGGGLSDITVECVSGGGKRVGTKTNNSGNYQITNLSAGTYNVYPAGAGTFTPNNQSVTLTQNQNVTGKDFRRI